MSGICTDGVNAESTSFLDYFGALPDPRQQSKVIYPLDEVLLLSLPASLAGTETFVDVDLFGNKKIGLLRRFKPITSALSPCLPNRSVSSFAITGA